MAEVLSILLLHARDIHGANFDILRPGVERRQILDRIDPIDFPFELLVETAERMMAPALEASHFPSPLFSREDAASFLPARTSGGNEAVTIAGGRVVRLQGSRVCCDFNGLPEFLGAQSSFRSPKVYLKGWCFEAVAWPGSVHESQSEGPPRP
jgi:hypothetical protein